VRDYWPLRTAAAQKGDTAGELFQPAAVDVTLLRSSAMIVMMQ